KRKVMEYSGKVYQGKYKYKYVPCGEGANAIIENATMKFTDPKDFNDPFDCAPSYIIGDFEKLVKNSPEPFKQAALDLKLSPARRIQEKYKMKARLKRALDDGSWQRSLQSEIGICSMTTKPCNLLMWSHYSKNHTGVVFEFHNIIPKLPGLDSHYLSAFHVRYESEKPIIDLSNASYSNDWLVKGVDWEYEDEIRCLNVEKKSGIHEYKRDLLASVILGARIEPSDEDKIRKLVNNVNDVYGLSIKVYKAEVLKDKFKLVIPNHPLYG
ncbi:TPA: DUF2971 domain-containing protein, partial [Vibrio cholerae]